MPLLLFVSAVFADEPAKTMREYTAKAAFLRNFTQYIEWPAESFASSDSPFVIGIFGLDPFGEDIDREVADRKSHGRPIVVRRLNRPEEAAGCQIVFISRAERHRQAPILAALEGRSTLTVGETDWFLRDGGGIRLMLARNELGKTRLDFEVNLKVLREAKLAASSRMLSLAERVVQ